MKKNLRALIGLFLALVVTSASAGVGGSFGLESAPKSPTSQTSVTGQ
jgi:hypothetical protein